MLNTPTVTRLARLPRLYQTENTPINDTLIHLHFFIGSCDWFIAEYDGEDLFFGFAVLGGDWGIAEWGYGSFNELKDIRIHGVLQVDCEQEQYWKVRKFSEVMNDYAPKNYFRER